MSDRAQRAGRTITGPRGWFSKRDGGLLPATATAVLALLGLLALLAVAPAAAQTATGSGQSGAAQYALIVNGDDSFTHNYNVSLALASLQQLGYAPQDTFVLAPAQSTAAAPAVWRQAASEQGLRQALARLHQRMRPGDLLLVYLTGHGYRMFGHTSLGLQSGAITASELMHQLAELPFGKLILIADQCYSGGFASAAVALGRNVVAVASTDDRHEVRCEPFIRPLWLAAVAAESDANHDGFVSVEQAFRVAVDGLRRAGGGTAEEAPRFATSGSCAGHENRFSAAAPVAPADTARAAGLAAPAAAAPAPLPAGNGSR